MNKRTAGALAALLTACGKDEAQTEPQQETAGEEDAGFREITGEEGGGQEADGPADDETVLANDLAMAGENAGSEGENTGLEGEASGGEGETSGSTEGKADSKADAEGKEIHGDLLSIDGDILVISLIYTKENPDGTSIAVSNKGEDQEKKTVVIHSGTVFTVRKANEDLITSVVEPAAREDMRTGDTLTLGGSYQEDGSFLAETVEIFRLPE